MVYYRMNRHTNHFLVQLLASDSFKFLGVGAVAHSLSIYSVCSHSEVAVVSQLFKVEIHFWGLLYCKKGFKSLVWVEKGNQIFFFFYLHHVLDVRGCCLSRSCIARR